MLNFKQNEDAVSPVIGVILMVAITVILAAVIAAFVFGMTDSIAPQKDAYITVTQGVATNGSAILTVTIQGGKDVNSLTTIQYSDSNADSPSFANVTGLDTAPLQIGDSGVIFLSTEAGAHHYVIRGLFTDGSVKVLAESDYTAA